MKTYLPIGAAVIAMVIVAIVQGNWTDRWNTFPEIELYAQQIPKVPKEIGGWSCKSEEKTDEKILDVAGAADAISRQYQNAKGDSIGVFVICGPPKELKFHTPDLCYPAAGFTATSEPTPEEIETADGKPSGFMTATYTKTEANGAHVAQRVYWSFTENGEWKAPDDFRIAFGGTRAMYKIYVTVQSGFRDKTGEGSIGKEFIRELLPALNKAFEPAYKHELAPVSADAEKKA